MPKKKESDTTTNTTVDISEVPETSSIRGIRYLTLQGGGMKGIGHLGAVEELERHGVLNQLEAVAGSSAGALMATLLAIGCNSDELKEEMASLDFKELQDKSEPGWIEAMQLGRFFGVGGKSEAEKIDSLNESLSKTKTSPISLSSFPEMPGKGFNFDGVNKAEDLAKLVFGSGLGVYEGDKLCDLLCFILVRRIGNPHLTFRQLEELVNTKGPPFKKLVLTGTNLTTKELEYYSAETTPDMPIFLAARISASFPGAFKPVVVKHAGGKDVKVDGGLLENLPDVFNKPPYSPPDPQNESGGNEYAFALSFKEEGKKRSKNPKNIIALAKALYSTKLSSNALKKKYERNIALIDTVGVGTLDFDASEKRKARLVASGARAVRKAFKDIINHEEGHEIQYERMPLKELVRREVSLVEALKINPKDEKMAAELRCVSERIEELLGTVALDEEKLDRIRKEERKKLKARYEVKSQAPSAEELEERCKEQRKVLDGLKLELERKNEQLHVVKLALVEYKEDVLGEYKENQGFRNDLTLLKEKQIEFNKQKMGAYYTKKSEQADLIALEFQQAALIRSMIDKYGKEAHLSYFFESLLEHVKNPRFSVPVSATQLSDFMDKELKECEGLILEVESEQNASEKRIRLLQELQGRFAKGDKSSERYIYLMNLKAELDRAVYRKTTLLSKIHNYFFRQGPNKERIARKALQVVAYVGFAVSFVPMLLPRTMAVALHFATKKEKRLLSFRKLLRSFGPADMEYNYRLQELKKVTKMFVDKVAQNYSSADQTELTYLYKLYAIHLKDSGIKIEDILERKYNETTEVFQARADELEARLGEFRPGMVNLSDLKEETANFERFLEDLLGPVALKFSEGKEFASPEERTLFLSKTNRKLELEFLHKIDTKIKAGIEPNLTNRQVARYLSIAERPELQEQHETAFQRFQKLYKVQIAQVKKTQGSSSIETNKESAFRMYKQAKKKGKRRVRQPRSHLRTEDSKDSGRRRH